ncbi:hypothetical protein [Pseudomonas denitrificans (nom. rej.)]|uniref:Uncharacterized protein n=1 Tax=Pseudomonas denitrificans TaxID=43306 RepID=A0A9X7N4S0_PSEDE|nr:hypothetical protein [Pseudomonas denitrificans (nom. rej.)]QEY75060.1 hypothetical protein F1C79_27455 [Pseudomonas denitrificans (nom. rej.)]
MTAIKSRSSPFERYCAYVNQLELAGGKFPVNQFGDVNFSKIADECGNRRQWFSESAKKIFGDSGQPLERVIANDIRRIGSDVTASKDPESVLIDLAESKSREVSQLRSMLDQKSKENELLRSHVERLAAELRLLRSTASELSSQHEMMVDSGRSFIL